MGHRNGGGRKAPVQSIGATRHTSQLSTRADTAVSVVVPLETRLNAFIIHDVGLLLCAPYCHATIGAAKGKLWSSTQQSNAAICDGAS